MPDGFSPTWIYWYNDTEGAKIACQAGSYEDIPYGSQGHVTPFHASGKPPHPEHGQFQWGLACSKTSRTIVADVDHPEHWKQGATYVELGDIAECATSYREDGERFHIVIMVPEELVVPLWPVQGPTVWGDVKSNGFSYHEGVHAKGLRYVASANPWITADADLLKALTEDRIFPQGRGPTGSMAGTWWEEGYGITSHDQCVADVMAMAAAGLDHGEITSRLEDIMPNREGDWPGREAYIDEKIRSAFRKIEMREQREQERWGYFHPGGFAGLAQDVARRRMENIERATPAGIQADTTEFIQHHIERGSDFLTVPKSELLNPLHRPIEPHSGNDESVALDILETALPFCRFAADQDTWLEFTGTSWVTSPVKPERYSTVIVAAYGKYMKTEKQLTEEILAQGTARTQEEIDRDDARKEALGAVRKKFKNTPGRSAISSAMITEALGNPRYHVLTGGLDAEPDVLWAGGYPWSLRHETLTLATDVRPVNPVHVKTAACAPLPGPCPAFEQVLEAVWPDPGVRAWALREIAGLMLWGTTSKTHPVLDGPPGGGKSTFALILTRVLGNYAVQVSPEKILGGDMTSSSEEEIAAMIGARCVWMDEPPPRGRQVASRFNDLASGTGDLSASRKYQNRVSAPKRFNFLICQNPRNALSMDVQGVGERVLYIPCTGTPEATRAAWSRWMREGEAEYPAILAMLIRECALFHSGDRLEIPVAALSERMSAQERADEFGTWLTENYTILAPDTPTVDPRLENAPTVGSLRQLYNAGWARDNGVARAGRPEVEDQLRRLGVRVATARSSRTKDVAFVLPKPVMMRSSY